MARNWMVHKLRQFIHGVGYIQAIERDTKGHHYQVQGAKMWRVEYELL